MRDGRFICLMLVHSSFLSEPLSRSICFRATPTDCLKKQRASWALLSSSARRAPLMNKPTFLD